MTALLLAVVLAMEAVEPAGFYAANDELRGYLIEAGENHPGLRAAYERWRASLHVEPQASALEDPTLTYGQFLRSDFNRSRIAVEQKFPWFGTRSARGDKAEAEAHAQLQRFYNERNRVFANVKQNYFEYAFLSDQIDLVEAEIELLTQMEETALSRMGVGLATDADALLAQIERTELEDNLRGLHDQRPALSAQLAESIGRTPGEVLPWPKNAKPAPPPPPVPVAVARARTVNPELEALDKLIESHEHAVTLARKDGKPDFAVGFEYMSISKPDKVRPDRPFPASLNALDRTFRRATGQAPNLLSQAAIDTYAIAVTDEPVGRSAVGDDNISVSLTLTVPIYRGKIKAGVREAQHLKMAAELDKERTELRLDQAVRTTLYEYQDARRRENVFAQALLPQAEQRYESLTVAYGAAMTESDFVDVLESAVKLLEFELKRAMAERDQHIAAARLEFLLGGSWTTTPETDPGEQAQQEGSELEAAPVE